MKKLLLITAAFLFVSAAALLDLRSRAKAAFLEGERHYSWIKNPGLKEEYYAAVFAKRQQEADSDLREGRITEAKHREITGSISSARRVMTTESSAKQAYKWYKTAATDFCPPQNKWSRLAAEKAAAARELWRQELLRSGKPAEERLID